MKALDFTIDVEDLKVLFVLTRCAYGQTTFCRWLKEIQAAYTSYAEGKAEVKTFSQWVNGQIIALT